MPSASEALAAFAASLCYADIPAEVVEKTKRHLLDLLGVALASSTQSFARSAYTAAAAMSGRGDATVIGFSERLPPAWAALVNGTLAHGIDFDDTHQGSVVHVSASVVPAALAAAESNGTDGESFLTALVIGLESAVRVGLVAGGGFHDRGFHPTGICGTFAAALIAGKLGGLDPAQLADALGLCGSLAAGSLEFLTDGSWAKRIHGGWAAHSGLTAATLALHGMTGPREVFEGRFGLYRSHLGDSGWDLSCLTRELGQRWELLDIALKPYPCCHYNHAFIDCAAQARALPGFAPDAIERVECFVAPRQMPIVCEPEASKRVPQTDYDAKFSLPYAVACMLVRGHVDVDDFTPTAIRDPAVLRLAERIACHPEPSADFPRRFPARLRLALRGGESVEWREPINRGSAERPLDDAEVRAKFERNARRALPAAQTEALATAVADLHRAASIETVTDRCALPPSTAARAAG